ncbi:MAG: hypothetical protein K0Q75_2231, partial [Anaerospora sp.]|nr:hypothetical protein [Anaerospora sp.]
MSKVKIKFCCTECGADSLKWLGRCPGCGAWNTMVEEIAAAKADKRIRFVQGSKPKPITQVDTTAVGRRITGVAEFDRVLGGGIVPGALMLIGGDPGIGKSTLLLQVAAGVSAQYGPVLYVSGEESAVQTRMRAERLGSLSNHLFIMTETN